MSEVQILEMEYEAVGPSMDLVSSSSSCYLNDEQAMSVRSAFSTIQVRFEYDPVWGYSKIIAVNGMLVNVI